MKTTRRLLWLGLLCSQVASVNADPIRLAGRLEGGGQVSVRPLPTPYERFYSEWENLHREAVSSVETFDGEFTLEVPHSGAWIIEASREGSRTSTLEIAGLVDHKALAPLALEAGSALWSDETSGWVGSERTGDTEGWRRSEWVSRVSSASGRMVARGEVVEFRAFPVGPLAEESSTRYVRILSHSGEPVPSAVLVADGRWPVGVSDEEGFINLQAGIDRYPVAVFAEDGRQASVSALPSGESIELRLHPLRFLEGEVLHAGSREPIPGALVWEANRAGDWVTTDSSGRYRIATPSEGQVVMHAAARGFFGGSETFTLTTSGPDAERGPSFALSPSARVEGVLVSETGVPFPRARVRMEWKRLALGNPVEMMLASRQAQRRTVTSEAGEFILGPLPPNVPWTLSFETLSGYSEGFAMEKLAPGERRDVSVVLPQPGGILGEVEDPDGTPASDCEVLLVKTDSTALLRRHSVSDWTSFETTFQCGADGTFASPSLSPGVWGLIARSSSAQPQILPEISVEPGTQVHLPTILLEYGQTIHGHVVDAESGTPLLASVTLSLRGRSAAGGRAETGAGARYRAQTDQEGWFEIFAVPALDLEIVASASGYQARRFPVPVEEDKAVLLELQRSGSVAGWITDETGAAVEGALVELAPPRGALRRLEGILATRSDGVGRFEFEDVRSGPFELKVRREGYANASFTGFEMGGGDTIDDLEFVLTRGIRVSGTVRDADRVPVAEVRVSVAGKSGETDSQGSFFLDGLKPGSYRILLSYGATLQESRVFDLSTDEHVELFLEPAWTLEGRVVSELGDPIAEAEVFFIRADGKGRVHQTTDAAGRFEVEAMQRGLWWASASHPDWANAPQETLEIQGPVSGLRLSLPRGSTASGALRGVKDEDLSRIDVVALGSDGSSRTGRVSADSSYQIDGLASGDWTVRARISGSDRAAQARLAIHDRDVDQDLVFDDGLVLEGQVLVSGVPAWGALLRGRSANGGGDTMRLDRQGRFRMTGLEPGQTILEVEGDSLGYRYREIVEIHGDREVAIDIRLGRLEGQVVDERGSPVFGVEIHAAQDGHLDPSQRVLTVGSNGDGEFAFDRLPAGRWRVWTRTTRGAGEVTADVHSGEITTVLLGLGGVD